jgi:heme/copper-type cytochrome/quinol oxidase subunit 2
VPVRPSRLPAALACLGLAAVLTGCAGTDEPVPAGSSTSSSSSSPASTSASAVPSAPAVAGQRIEVTVTGGQVTGDTGRVPVPAGEHVTLVVTSDAPDELHVHGYDLGADLAPGTPATVEFDATIPGVFEVELHDAGTLLLSLQVS